MKRYLQRCPAERARVRSGRDKGPGATAPAAQESSPREILFPQCIAVTNNDGAATDIVGGHAPIADGGDVHPGDHYAETLNAIAEIRGASGAPAEEVLGLYERACAAYESAGNAAEQLGVLVSQEVAAAPVDEDARAALRLQLKKPSPTDEKNIRAGGNTCGGSTTSPSGGRIRPPAR